MNFLFVIEASSSTGMGHVIRTNLIADALSKRGHRISFASLSTADTKVVKEYSHPNGVANFEGTLGTLSQTQLTHFDIVVVDILNYRSFQYLNNYKTIFVEIVNDKIKYPSFDYHLTMGPKKSDIFDSTHKYFFGEEFVVTSTNYQVKSDWNSSYSNFVVCLGSTSNLKNIELILNSIQNSLFNKSNITIYSKERFHLSSRFNLSVTFADWDHNTYLAKLAKFDVLICTASTVFWEGLKIGIPMLVTKIADNQSQIIDYASAHGYPIFDIQVEKSLDDVLGNLDCSILNHLAISNSTLVPHDGAQNVAKFYESLAQSFF